MTFAFHVTFSLASYFLLMAFDDTPNQHLEGLSYMMPTFFIGVSQLLYMVPAVIIARVRGAHAMAKGFLIAAAVTFLLNATCFGLATLG